MWFLFLKTHVPLLRAAFSGVGKTHDSRFLMMSEGPKNVWMDRLSECTSCRDVTVTVSAPADELSCSHREVSQPKMLFPTDTRTLSAFLTSCTFTVSPS